MTRSDRFSLIQTIEKQRDSKILVFFIGDRRGLETRIAADSLPFCLNHLNEMGKQKKIDLFLYSTGGVAMDAYGLVNVIREFCDSLNVIIPFKAFSAATLISLGANEILMTKMGQLSPIDPSVNSPFGPQIVIPGQQLVQTVPINVEDVVGYLDIARNELGIKDEDLMQRVLDRLSQSVNPLALGAVNRSREQIGFLARTLLSQHMEDGSKVDKIVETLSRRRFSHNYLIGRKEAKSSLGLNVVDLSNSLEQTITSLYGQYNDLLELSNPYSAEIALGSQESNTVGLNRAIIESVSRTHVYRTTRAIRRVEVTTPEIGTPTVAYQERVISESWVLDNTI